MIRMNTRIKIFEALRGVKLTIVANDFSVIEKFDEKNFSFVQKSDFVTGLSAMCQSRLILNNLPNYRDGVTERLFNAQYRGCAVLTESNRFIRNNFDDGDELFSFGPNSLTDLKDIIEAIQTD